MSVIIGGDKIIAHSFLPPVVFDSIQEPGKRYVIADGQWAEIPNHLGYEHVIHFKKPSENGKHHAFKTSFEQEVDGSKGKKYTVKCNDDRWSCTCPAFGWSGGRSCKHIDQIKTENGWN